jgi:hypothetical protein
MAKTTELEKRFLKKVLTKIENRKKKLEVEREAWIKNKEELADITVNPKLNNAQKLGNAICELDLLYNELSVFIS